jgi:hypothetical protein
LISDSGAGQPRVDFEFEHGNALTSHVENLFLLATVNFFVNTVSVLLIVFTNVMFCFPYALPVTVPVRAHSLGVPQEISLMQLPEDDELQFSDTRRMCRAHDILGG